MNERIIYKRDDGGVSVIIPTGELPVEEVAKKDVPDGKDHKIVDVSEVPSDRTFRNAWDFDGQIKISMPKALAIAQNRVREVRGSKLAELDTAYIRADEQADNAKKRAVADKKQALRDATEDARLTGASDPDTLKVAMETIQSEIEATKP